MEESYQSKTEMTEHTAYKQVQQNLKERAQVHHKLETLKQTILTSVNQLMMKLTLLTS
ncbi:hypothetical protein PMSV_531 [Photobacterium leiognathi subsp. mandapamensis svers.1.1.]|nr:hypothetical protein PMSV_531 [Photobacterium leiognathi subsp. mandapamensis svers.1.1.]